MNHKYLYGGTPAEVKSAAGIRGMLIRIFGGDLMFRVYHDHESFTDYEIRHGDMAVTIADDELASFYRVGVADPRPQPGSAWLKDGAGRSVVKRGDMLIGSNAIPRAARDARGKA